MTKQEIIIRLEELNEELNEAEKEGRDLDMVTLEELISEGYDMLESM